MITVHPCIHPIIRKTKHLQDFKRPIQGILFESLKTRFQTSIKKIDCQINLFGVLLKQILQIKCDASNSNSFVYLISSANLINVFRVIICQYSKVVENLACVILYIFCNNRVINPRIRHYINVIYCYKRINLRLRHHLNIQAPPSPPQNFTSLQGQERVRV